MARRRKRRRRKKSNEFVLRLYGIVLIIASVFGFFMLGPVGRVISIGTIYLFGSMYLFLMALLLLLGAYMLFTNEWPDFFSTKLLGIYLFIMGFLSFWHHDFIMEFGSNGNVVFKKTIELLNVAASQIYTNGVIGDLFSLGGGLIGAAFSVVFAMLFSYTGMIALSIILMVVGACLFTGFSIFDFFTERLEEHQEEKKKGKEKEEKRSIFSFFKRDRDDDEDEEFDNTKQMSLSFDNVPINGQTAIGKKTYNSIEELNNSKKKESEGEVGKEEIKQEELIINENYQLPPLSILNKPKAVSSEIDRSPVEENFKKLISVLEAFGIKAEPINVSVGPTVSQYELEIASGTRLNKVTALNAEIASALAKKDVRIQAPIPGKSTVGIEFANDEATPVSFYEIMSSEQMTKNPDKKLMVPLGKNIMGEIGVCEINKMPHLLIAGTTGSGKSVCVNGIICSILMRARPDEVKLAMVDPKVVELSVYNDIPHLMCPVVSDPKQAAVLLQKMVNEMENRYHKFADTGTKKIEAYNDYIEKWNKKHPDEQKAKMPFIVVIIDELSDLMMVAAKEVEDSILRITQKARAAGIHLIVATQRPSTEVITGLIKANIPSRIAFAVGSGVDSRTILDKVGAEKLLGRGDMLYMPIGVNNPERIQGSFITDDEIKKLIEFTHNQQKPQYDETLSNLNAIEESSSEGGGNGSAGSVDVDDSIYNEVVDFVIKSQKASASLIQRKFSVGYNRAARLIDLLEERNIIGPQNGSKPRTVLVQYDADTGENNEK